VLSILSDAFFKWSGNMTAMKSALTSNISGDSRPGPRFFYPTTSAHLSQSDFGILFSWLIRRVLKTDQSPERYIKLNTRAILEVLREGGFEVANTSTIDREEQLEADKQVVVKDVSKTNDWKILDVHGAVPGWVYIDIDQTDKKEGAEESDGRSMSSTETAVDNARVENEVLGDVGV
jgi:platelet-activating factor acetylhydrolase